MLVLNVVVLMAVAFGLGYYFAKGQIVINKVANKEDSEKIREMAEEEHRKYLEALESYNLEMGALLGGDGDGQV